MFNATYVYLQQKIPKLRYLNGAALANDGAQANHCIGDGAIVHIRALHNSSGFGVEEKIICLDLVWCFKSRVEQQEK